MRPPSGKRKVKLAWIINENARKASLKKRKLGLVKKVHELTILCDVRACLIIFSADDAEPLVWPNHEVARGLLERYFALPDIERSKKATNQESYLKDKTGKAQEQLAKSQKKNKEAEMDHLMYEINNGARRIAELPINEIYALISYSRDKIGSLRKRGEMTNLPPLRSYPGENERQGDGNPAAEGDVQAVSANPMDDQNQYLMDQWIVDPPPGSSNVPLPLAMAPPVVPQQSGVPMMPYQEDPSYIHMGIPVQQFEGFLPGQGSGSSVGGGGGGGGGGSSSANPNVEMNLMPPHNPQGGFRTMSHQAPQQRLMNLNLNEGNASGGTSLVPMGLGLPPLGSGHGDHQAMLRSQLLGQYPPNVMAGELGMTGHVTGEGSSSRTPFELGLQQFGTDLRLQQQRGYGGEGSSSSGGLRLQPPGEGSSSAAPQQGDMGGPSGSNPNQ